MYNGAEPEGGLPMVRKARSLATLVPLLASMWLGINFGRATEGGQVLPAGRRR